MGTYLATPVTDKGTEEGDDISNDYGSLSWGLVDMQGWRKTMEDAHVAQIFVPPPPHFQDYPGGGNAGNDRAGDKVSPPSSSRVFAVFDGHGGAEVARFCQLYLVDVLTKQEEWTGENVDIGKALVKSFHGLDTLLDDPSRRDEINSLKGVKPEPSEARSTPDQSNAPASTQSLYPNENVTQSDEKDVQMTKQDGEDGFNDEKKTDMVLDGSITNDEKDNGIDNNENISMTEAMGEDESGKKEDGKDIVVFEEAGIQNDGDEDDSLKVARDETEELSSSDEEDSYEPKSILTLSSRETLALFRKFLSVRQQQEGNAEPITMDEQTNEETEEESGVIIPTKVINGRQVCNLPEHPIHAGCTAICAVIVGRTLTVANAGDSRAVLCRGNGFTEPLSFDHKPMNEIELNRITNAGGFVNQVGRVNGNLNLSRSIGDMKYKQVPNLSPPEQMITAEPDIKQVTLEDFDEFIILGCDGIWDCLSNEEAVHFVQERIETKTPVQIGEEMLDAIISIDPQETQGIGGDNMTVMIIDLLPHTRTHRNTSSPES